MTPISGRRHRILQFFVAAIWVIAIWQGVSWFASLGIPLRHLPRVLGHAIRSIGFWGPLVILALYLLRSVFFFVPATVLTLVAGSLYGPLWGTLLNIAGANLTANASFGLGRLFGRRFVREREHGWVKKYDALMRDEGFLTILFMRLLYFPFDLVSYASGATGIIYRQYFLGTLLGVIPWIVTFTVLGGAFRNPATIVTFLVLLAATISIVFLLRRSSWAKRHLPPEHVKEQI